MTTIPDDQRTNLDPYDILISHTRIDFDSTVDAAVVEAVNAGKSLFLDNSNSSEITMIFQGHLVSLSQMHLQI